MPSTPGNSASARQTRTPQNGRGTAARERARHLRPMLATPAKMPSGDEWAYEIKWDGMRALVALSQLGVQITTRNGNEVGVRYPELADLNDACDPDELPMLLDAEIVSFAPGGRPDFRLLQSRMHLANPARIAQLAESDPVHLAIFDIVVYAGRPVTEWSYDRRREVLESLNLKHPHASVPAAYDDGRALMESMIARGMEGVIAKRRNSSYRAGERTGDWLKIKTRPRDEFVVGGWTPGEGRREGSIGALMVGRFNAGGGLEFLGGVGSGIAVRDAGLLLPLLESLSSPADPFTTADAPRATRFVRPEVVVEVEYQEITGDNRLRQPVFLGLRTDKRAPDVRIEELR